MNLLTKFTSSSRSTKPKDIFPWNISQVITFDFDHISASCFEFNGKSVETETTTSEFSNEGKAIVEQILASEEVQKSRTMRFTVRDPSRKINHLSKVTKERKVIIKFTMSIISTRIV